MPFAKGIINFITSAASDLRETAGNLWSATSHSTVQVWWLVGLAVLIVLYFRRR